MDYVNRVEIKGTLTFDVTKRKSNNGNDWLTFAVMTRAHGKGVYKERSIYTSVQACIFDQHLVEKVTKLGLRRGSKVWLVGSLFAKKVEKHGYTFSYVSVVVDDIDIVATPKRIKKG